MHELLPDTRLSHYRIISKIGEGGMGEVYLAEDLNLRRKVAIKILPETVAIDENLRRFEQEAFAVSALNHPNILTIYEVGEADGMHFIVSEYVAGELLRDRIKNLTINETLDISTQIAAALEAAHKSGIVHRDIKPENIMLREDGVVKVVDFGLAKITQQSPKDVDTEGETLAHVRTKTGTVMGTASYMSPEQARGKDIDEKTDIWSLGVVIYEMLTRKTPFNGGTQFDVIASILRSDPQPVESHGEFIPPDLAHIVRKALRKDKDSRYQTMKSLLADLREVKDGIVFSEKLERSTAPNDGRKTSEERTARFDASSQPLHPRGDVLPDHRRKRLTFGLIASVLVLSTLGAVYWYWNDASKTQISSIAVMPFENESGNADTEYLSDGMTETLISSLSQLPNLNVKARSSVFRYKGKETNTQTIGKELNVQAILNGRVVQRGEQLTLSLELVDVQNDKVLWTESYQRKQSDLVSLQSEIAKDVSSKLKTRLSGAEEAKVTKTETTNPRAYQLYLKGRFHFGKRTKEDLLRSIESYEQAISHDANFALAYVGVADSYSVMSGYGYAAPNDVFPKARAAAQRALQLDPDLAEAHAAYAMIAAEYDWNWAEAEREFKRSIEINPNVALSHYQYGGAYLTPMGRFDEAASEIKRALDLDPLSVPHVAYLGSVYVFARKNDLAVQQVREALSLEPDHPTAKWALAFAYNASGMYAEAISTCETALRADPGNQDCLQMVGYAYAKTGRRREAEDVIRKFEELSRTGYVITYRPAVIHALLGDKERAFAGLEKSFSARDWDIARINVDPFVDSLRDDPRFKNLLKRMNLPE
ncbi:MAG: protein kinase domain-containing protein [Pyrinomonadaceae bacterium]